MPSRLVARGNKRQKILSLQAGKKAQRTQNILDEIRNAVNSYSTEGIARQKAPSQEGIADSREFLSAKNWRGNPGSRALMQRASEVYINGKSYFGHGNWYAFLAHELGISPLSKEFMPDKRLNLIIKKMAGEFGTVAGEWSKDTKNFYQGMYNRKALYGMIQRRKVNGVPFMGYGDWYTYLDDCLKIQEITGTRRENIGRRGPAYSDRQINLMVNEQIDAGMKRNILNRNQPGFARFEVTQQHWAGQKKPFKEGELSLNSVYHLVSNRSGKNRLKFMGYGSWYRYLEKVHGIQPTHHIFMPAEKVNYFVKKAIDSGISLNSEHWFDSRNPYFSTGHSLAQIYDIIYQRKVKGKGFMGQGDWYSYLKNVHNIPDEKLPILSDAELEALARQVHGANPGFNAGKWQSSRESIPIEGKVISGVRHEAGTTTVGGLYQQLKRRGFLGKGTLAKLLAFLK